MFETHPEELPVEISPEDLSAEAMDGIIQNFVLREGTDYGLVEVSYQTKAEQVRRQIKQGAVRIVFDLTTETVSLLTERDFKLRIAKK
ncbi:MAG: YheU family protein [Bdellovibrionales bacterium]|nr:YheU family protein [Bdellovibrionales bacterium]